MSNRASPLGTDFVPGKYDNQKNGVGVHLNETRFEFMGELAAFPDGIVKVEKLVGQIASSDENTILTIAANRWFVAGPVEVAEKIKSILKPTDGSLVDLTHGRTSLLITGAKAEWVLSKLYAIDFSLANFPVGSGLSSAHHIIFTHIHRPYKNTFDLFVPRSLARSFWHTLCRACQDVGYKVE